jgi:hypothetical protein
MADQAHRAGVAERFPEPAVQQRLDGDLARLDSDDARLRDVELTIRHAATPHDANTRYRWPTVPGLGQMLSLGRLDDISDSHRFPRVQALASYGRVVTGAKASHGNRAGRSGTNIGQAHLPSAFAAAAGFCRRENPAGQQRLVRFETQHGQGNALTLVAHQWSRAVSHRFKRKMAVDRHRCWSDEGRGVGAPDASRDNHGMTLLATTLKPASITASLNASERRGHEP